MFARNTQMSKRHRLSAWVALWSLVLGALLPVLSHAVVRAPSDGQGWVEVCTASGMAWVSSASADADASDRSSSTGNGSSGMVMAGCDWCATHASAPALPPVADLPALSLMGTHLVPDAFLQAPRLLAVWSTAHSRAPPHAA